MVLQVWSHDAFYIYLQEHIKEIERSRAKEPSLGDADERGNLKGEGEV
jgi:hypothetical protein